MDLARLRLRGLIAVLTIVGLTACGSMGGAGYLPSPQTPESLTLQCKDWAGVRRGPYRVENNTWGKEDRTRWSQCVGLGIGTEDYAVARFTWDWLGADGENVKSYPTIIYGQKPTAGSTTSLLPRQISSLSEVLVAFSGNAIHDGVGNVALDIWLTHSVGRADFSASSVKYEIMIWLASFGDMKPAGTYRETVEFDGVAYDVYQAERHGGGWRYVAFNPQRIQLASQAVDVMKFLRYLQTLDDAVTSSYLASVELGAEIVSGVGELRLNRFSVTTK